MQHTNYLWYAKENGSRSFVAQRFNWFEFNSCEHFLGNKWEK